MSHEDARELARRLVCSSMAQSEKIERIARGFLAAYDDGRRDEADAVRAGKPIDLPARMSTSLSRSA